MVGLKDKDTACLGMLVCDPTCRGKGIGTRLIDSAEIWAKDINNCVTMRLEILSPRCFRLESKEFLKAWYSRIGYVSGKTEPFEDKEPHLVDKLACDCDFTVWLKLLI